MSAPPVFAHDKMTEARLAGHTWGDIHAFIDQKKQAAASAGYSDDEIKSFLGYNNSPALDGTLRAMAEGETSERSTGK